MHSIALPTICCQQLHFFAFTLRKPPEDRNLERLEATNRTVKTVLDILDRALSDTRYLLGDRFTLADAGAASAIATLRYDKTLPSVAPWTHTARWLAEICARPSWARVMDDVKDTPPPPWERRTQSIPPKR